MSHDKPDRALEQSRIREDRALDAQRLAEDAATEKRRAVENGMRASEEERRAETPRRRRQDHKPVIAWMKDFLPIIISVILMAVSAVLYAESRAIDRTYADKDAQIARQSQEISDLRTYNTTQDTSISALATAMATLAANITAVTKSVDNLTQLMQQHILGR